MILLREISLTLFISILISTFIYADGEDISITVSDASSVYEYDDSATFEIKLSENPNLCDEVVVNYSTKDGSATAGSDYNSTVGSVTFYGYCFVPPRIATNSAIVKVPIIDDSEYEDRENFYLDISNSTAGYSVTKSRGEAIIYSDDTMPVEAKIHNRYENEKDENWTLNVSVELNQNAPTDITLNFSTIDGTAHSGSEYIAKSGTLTIPKGSKWGYIPITIIGDLTPEDTKSFYVSIDNISSGTITRDRATITLVDDDAIRVYISSTDTNEGNSSSNNKIPFKIYLSKAYPLSEPLSISYSTQDGSAPSATSSIDYTPVSGTVTFNSGDTQKIVYVPIIGDEIIEEDERVGMRIEGDYVESSYSEAQILNDDGSFSTISFADCGRFYIQEGNSSTRVLNFKINLDRPAIAGASFDYYTLDGSAKSSDSDYTKIEKRTYTFNGGESSIVVGVDIIGDTKIEDDESFYLKLENPNRLNLKDTQAKGYIINDDGSFPTLRIKEMQYSTYESNSSTTDINITLVLDKEAVEGSSFTYKTLDYSAKASDNDYIAIPSTTYNFQKGQREVTIPVKIVGDTKVEEDEYFLFKIEDFNNLNESCSSYAQIYILNDDGEYPRVSIVPNNMYLNEGDLNVTKTMEFNITLDRPAVEDGAYIKFKTYDATATANDLDYVAIPETKVVFNRGERVKSFYVTVNGDDKVEDDEYFYVKLFSASHLIKDDYRLKIVIKNDDEHSSDPFLCDRNMYISSSINRETMQEGRMWLHIVDTTTNPFELSLEF